MEIQPFISNGNWNVKIKEGNRIVTLHSIDPYQEARRITEHFNPSFGYVLVAGMGLGYLVEYLIKNTNYSVFVFEHTKEIIELAKEKRGLDKILFSSRLKIFHNENDLFDFLDENFIKEFNYYINRQYASLFPEIYQSFAGHITAYLSRKHINQSTLKRFQKVWLRNIVKNSFFYFDLPGIVDITHNFTGKPAVIVGAGPSLMNNIEVLKELQDNVIIISTDTAYLQLVKSSIMPDFIVSVDPQEKNSLYVTGVFTKNCPFLVIDSAVSFLTLVNYPQDRIIIYDTIFPLYEILSRFWGSKGKLNCGGSVSTTAFDLARFFGCNPVIFVGQDLAFSSFKTHSSLNLLENIFLYKTDRFKNFETYNSKILVGADRIEIKGNTTSVVITDRKFLTFLDWFKREIKQTSSAVINATEGGAYIDGCIHMPLKDVIYKYGIDKKLDKHIEIRKNDLIQNREAFIKFLKEVFDLVDYLIPFAGRSLEVSMDLLANFEKIKNLAPFFNKMGEFDKILLDVLKSKKEVGRFIELTMQNVIERILSRGEEDKLTEELISTWVDFYREAKEGLFYIRHILKKRIRLEERN